MNALGRQAARGGQVELLHQVQLLEQDVAARIRRHFIDAMALIVDVDRLVAAGLEGGQIVACEQTAVLLHEAGDLAGDLTFVEGGTAPLGDGPEGLPQVALVENIAGCEGLSAGGEDRPGVGIAGEALVLRLQDRGELVTDRKTSLAEFDRRRQDLVEPEPAEGAMRQQPAVDDARHRYAQNPLHGDAAALEVELAGGRGGRRPGAVDPVDPARSGVVEHEETVAPHARAGELDHAKRRSRGDGGVHGVSARLQNPEAGLGGERMAGGHGSVQPHDVGSKCGIDNAMG